MEAVRNNGTRTPSNGYYRTPGTHHINGNGTHAETAPSRSVLFINRVYPPVEGATGEMLADIANGLARDGWDVTVLTSAAPGQIGTWEWIEGVRVRRVRARGFTRSSRWQRIVAYLLLYPVLFWHALRHPQVDVIVTKTDPPLQLVLGALLKLVKRCRVVHWAQDLYPELAEALKVIRHRGLRARSLTRVSNWALGRHDDVVAIGRCMKTRLEERGLEPVKITVIPNWAPVSIRPVEHEENIFRTRRELAGRFVVMYSGNMGIVHPFEPIIDAAARVKEEHPDVLFLFVGDGPRLPWLRKEAAHSKLDNVRFLPFQPKKDLHLSLSAADIHLVSMLENACGLVVPSKIYGVLAAGRPCIFLGPEGSEAARLIRENGCGEVLSRPTGESLAACIVDWCRDHVKRDAAGQRARLAATNGAGRAVSAFEIILDGEKEPAGARPVHPAVTKATAM